MGPRLALPDWHGRLIEPIGHDAPGPPPNDRNITGDVMEGGHRLDPSLAEPESAAVNPTAHSEPMAAECILGVLVPTKNEAQAIGPFLDHLALAASRLPDPRLIEVTIIDGGSEDGTLEIAAAKTSSFARLRLVHEPEPGIGIARRRGAAELIARSHTRRNPLSDEFWMLSTDADTICGETWLLTWYDYLSKRKTAIAGGPIQFFSSFEDRFPNATRLRNEVSLFSGFLEELFGVTNLDGANMLIERSCYQAVGPFPQPRATGHGTDASLLAGEDWTLSLRARLLGYPLRRERDARLEVSPRRFEAGPLEYIEGRPYDRAFARVDGPSNAPDLPQERLGDLFLVSARRKVMHFATKPLLAIPDMLESAELKVTLGRGLMSKMASESRRIAAKDVLADTFRFVNEELPLTHRRIGGKLTAALLEVWQEKMRPCGLAALSTLVQQPGLEETGSGKA